MSLDELAGNCILLVNNSANFCIDLFHRALGDMLGLSHGAAEEHFVLVFAVDHRTHHIAHTVADNHVAGHLSGAFKVVGSTGCHLMHEDFFGNTSAEQDGDTRQQILLVIRIVVFGRQLHRQTQSTSARNNRDFVHRIALRHQTSNQSVAGFVISRVAFFVFGHDHGLAFGTHHDLVFSAFEVFHSNYTAIAAGSKQSSFVDEVRQIGTGEARGTASEDRFIHVGADRNLAHMNFQNLLTAADIGQRNHDLTVKAARTQQCGVENVGAIRGSDHDDAAVGVETVHLDEHLVQSLFAFVIASAETGAALTADRINFVDEDDAGRILLSVLEHVANTSGTDTDEHFNEVGTGNRKEGNLGFAGDGFGQKSLTGTRRADEQHTARNTTAQSLIAARILEVVHNFGHFFFGFIAACNIGKSDIVIRAVEHSGFRFAEAESTALSAALHLAHEENPHADEDQHREPRNKDRS